jgi:hypothetical protein
MLFGGRLNCGGRRPECECGACTNCKARERNRRYYQRHRARLKNRSRQPYRQDLDTRPEPIPQIRRVVAESLWFLR